MLAFIWKWWRLDLQSDSEEQTGNSCLKLWSGRSARKVPGSFAETSKMLGGGRTYSQSKWLLGKVNGPSGEQRMFSAGIEVHHSNELKVHPNQIASGNGQRAEAAPTH
jgi:hypothetical protein